MPRLKEKIDVQEWFRRADSLLFTSKLINTQPFEVAVTHYQGDILCSSCCIELQMKILAQIQRGTPPLKGHNLKELMHDLTAPTYARLKRAWEEATVNERRAVEANPGHPVLSQYPTDFATALERSSKAFIAWRYGKSDEIKGWYIGIVAQPLRTMIIEANPGLKGLAVQTTPLDPESGLIKTEDDHASRPLWAPVFYHETTPLNIKVRRGSDPKNGGPA